MDQQQEQEQEQQQQQPAMMMMMMMNRIVNMLWSIVLVVLPSSDGDFDWWTNIKSFLLGATCILLIWFWQSWKHEGLDELEDDNLSWIDPWNNNQKNTWKVTVEDWVSLRIGELPNTIKVNLQNKNKHWPWETIRRRVFSVDDLSNHEKNHVNVVNVNVNDSRNNGLSSSLLLDVDDDLTIPDDVNDTENNNNNNNSDNNTNDDSYHDGNTSNPPLPPPHAPKQICIGSIFGLDVGGTLAKLVYFEQKPHLDYNDYNDSIRSSSRTTTATARRKHHYSVAASAQAVFMARRGDQETDNHPPTNTNTNTNISTATTTIPIPIPRRRSLSLGCMGRFKNLQKEEQQKNRKKNQNHQVLHSKASDVDVRQLKELRQESLPDDLDQYDDIITSRSIPLKSRKVQIEITETTKAQTETTTTTMTSSPNIEQSPSDSSSPQEDNENNNKNSNNNKESSASSSSSASATNMKKSKSMFDLSSLSESQKQKKAEALDRFYNFANRLDSYQDSVRDHQLSFYSRELGGEFHFIHFETRRMKNAMDLIRYNQLHLNICEMGATGGGAHKYAKEWEQILGIEMDKQDELDSLVAGMQFVLSTVIGECFTFRPKHQQDMRMPTTPTTSNIAEHISGGSGSGSGDRGGNGGDGGSSGIDESASSSSCNALPYDDSQIGAPLVEDASDDELENEEEKQTEKQVQAESGSQPSRHTSSSSSSSNRADSQVDEWWWSRKVQRDAISYSSAYPYLLVTIGTGVSILRVDGPRQHERISGSTIGGGTYWGLIRLLTDVEDFDDVMKLAEKGDPAKVDMMVGDIYGENSDALEKLGLPSHIVASSFGKLVAKQDPAAGLKQEDLARALLLMVTNNIGQVAYLNAKLHNTPRIYFVGNFLRRNMISQQRLSYAIQYWSKGEMEALFLEHEGYFGALGAFLMSQNISHGEEGFFQWDSVPSMPQSETRHHIPESKSSHSFMHRRMKTFES